MMFFLTFVGGLFKNRILWVFDVTDPPVNCFFLPVEGVLLSDTEDSIDFSEVISGEV